MSSPRDYYEVLGVPRTASADDLRRAHRRLARTLHPDVNKASDAAARFAEVQEAYDTLSDEEKRKAYDRFGHADVGATGAGANAGRARTTTWSSGGSDVDPEAFASVFEEFFGNRGRSPFSTGPGRTPRRSAAARGEDAEHSITITFMTAALGGVERVRVPGSDGQAQELEVRIPPGIDDGARLRVRGRGRPGGPGAPAGDMILHVHVGDHPCFRREGLDVLIDVPITIAEAALGATITVPLLQGFVDMKIPAGASSGRRLRLRERGLVDARGRRGDFFTVIQIVAPGELIDHDRQALAEMAGRLKNPRESLAWFRATGEVGTSEC